MYQYWIILSFATLGCLSQNYSVTEISTSSGLYYEKIGDVLLSNEKWEFVTAINYANYRNFYKYLHMQAQKIKEFCQDQKSSECEDRVDTVKVALERIEDVNKNIETTLGIEKQGRLKSALQIATTHISDSFMNNGELETYLEEITNLRRSRQGLSNQFPKQTTFFLANLDRKINQFERFESVWKNSVDKKSNEPFLAFIRAQTKPKNTTKDKIHKELNNLTRNFNVELSKFEVEQRNLLNIIKYAEKGIFSLDIITLEDLIKMMREVEQKLSEYVRFPFVPISSNIASLSKLMKRTVYFHNNNVLFVLEVPLVYRSSFDLYKMTSLPMRLKDEHFIFVLPQKDYLLINERSNHLEYLLSSAEDLRKSCVNTRSNSFICEQMQQISASAAPLPCEAQIFLNKGRLSTSCETRVLNTRATLFLQLQEYGSWIYVAPQPTKLTMSWGDERLVQVVTGTGILHVSEGYVTRTSDVVLVPRRRSQLDNVTNVYIPRENLADLVDTSAVEDHVRPASSDLKAILLSDVSVLRRLSTRIKDVARATGSGLLVAILVIVTVVLLLILCLIGRIYFARR